MRAFATPAFFEPGHLTEAPNPEPQEGEVLIRVKAAGLNTTDLACMAGMLKDYMEHKFPLIPGIDASGVVERVGPGVEGFAPGDEVFGFESRPLVGRGSFAEWVALPASALRRKPDAFQHHQAATIPHSALTATAAVEAAAPKPGAKIALLGATGGVGSYATQMLARAGAEVIALTVGDYADYARSLGASDVIDYGVGDPAATVRERFPDGIDAAIDVAGVPPLLEALGALVKPGGRVVSIVAPPDVEALAARGVEGVLTTRYQGEHRFDEITSDLVEGRLQLPAIQSFAFDEVEKALALQSTRHVRGKLVLVMD